RKTDCVKDAAGAAAVHVPTFPVAVNVAESCWPWRAAFVEVPSVPVICVATQTTFVTPASSLFAEAGRAGAGFASVVVWASAPGVAPHVAAGHSVRRVFAASVASPVKARASVY